MSVETVRDEIVFAYLDEPPFCFPVEGGGARGCDVELIIAALRELGVESVTMRLTSFAELLPGLDEGRWTVTTPLFVTQDRKRIVDFSRPVWALSDGLLVRERDRERLNGYEAVARDKQARLVVVADQVQERTGLAAGVPEARMRRVATQEDAVAMVRSGEADAYASVAMAHRGYLARAPEPGLTVVAIAGSKRAEGGFALAKPSGRLRQELNRVLARLVGSAWHREMMMRHGFAAEDLA